MENRVYFLAGDKSFDITEELLRSETWFTLVERRRNLQRKMTISRKILIWVCHLMSGASRIRGNIFRRWKLRDHLSTYFCSLKFNNYGRFINLVAVQGQRRSVIIIPENSFNAGWVDLASKIETFIHRRRPTATESTREIAPTREVNFAAATASTRWTAKSATPSVEQSSDFRVKVSSETPMAENELLNRCVVGRFSGIDENPTASDVRRWVMNKWTNVPGINVYELNGFQYLFEFPSKSIAEHIMMGEWRWRNALLKMEWWSPMTSCFPTSTKFDWMWIRVLGLPLHLWSPSVMKEIGEKCRGWVETEEETQLKNHMRWARIKVTGTPEKIPRFVEVENEGLIYKLPIWCECPVTVATLEVLPRTEGPLMICNEVIEVAGNGFFRGESSRQSVDCLELHGISETQVEPTIDANLAEDTNEEAGRVPSIITNEGDSEINFEPDIMAQVLSQTGILERNLCSKGTTLDPFLLEIEAISLLSSVNAVITFSNSPDKEDDDSIVPIDQGLQHMGGGDSNIGSPNIEDEGGEEWDLNIVEGNQLVASIEPVEVITNIENSSVETDSGNQLVIYTGSVEPIEVMKPMENMEAEWDASLWVFTNILKLSKQFGVNFQGCELEALSLFMKIDKRRKENMVENSQINTTLKLKGSREVENLKFDVKFKEGSARSRGKRADSSLQ